jgi:hypothetical protein
LFLSEARRWIRGQFSQGGAWWFEIQSILKVVDPLPLIRPDIFKLCQVDFGLLPRAFWWRVLKAALPLICGDYTETR